MSHRASPGLFAFLTVSFNLQFLILTEIHLSAFSFHNFRIMSDNLCLSQGYRDFFSHLGLCNSLNQCRYKAEGLDQCSTFFCPCDCEQLCQRVRSLHSHAGGSGCFTQGVHHWNSTAGGMPGKICCVLSLLMPTLLSMCPVTPRFF